MQIDSPFSASTRYRERSRPTVLAEMPDCLAEISLEGTISPSRVRFVNPCCSEGGTE